MTLPALLGVFAALAFVLGLLFVALRLMKHLPALGRSGSEGPELRVMGRAGLSPKQGVATVRAGGRTLVVGYGEGGVRMLTELEGGAPAADHPGLDEAGDGPGRVAGEPRGASPAAAAASGRTRLPTSPIPFPAALKKALRRVGVAGIAVMLGVSMAAPATAAPLAVAATTPLHAAPGTTDAGAFMTAAVALPQDREAVQSPRVDGPEGPDPVRAPGADFPSVSVSVGDGDGSDLRLSGPVGTVLFVGFLTLLPAVLLLMTSFTRILVVLHLLKQAIGTQTAPPAQLLTAMALLLTGFVMSPTLQEANRVGVRPWMDGRIDEMQMLDSASGPFRQFMLGTVRDSDIRAFMEMQPAPAPGDPGAAEAREDQGPEDIPLPVLASAFVTSELRSAFQMGFALFLPFVIIDIVVASVLMSMGMFMLPPVMVSLPFKLLLFVMVDGWALVVGSLVRSFG